MSNKHRPMVFALIMLGVVIIAVAMFIAMVFVFSPSTFSTAPTAAPITYDYNDIVDDLTDHEGAENLCTTLYPDISNATKYKSYFWDDTINPTVIQVKIYPEVRVLNDTALVWFNAYEAHAQRWIPDQNGRHTVEVTDPIEYTNILNAALEITNGNRGYMAYWKVALNSPGNYSASGSCTPIPYSK